MSDRLYLHAVPRREASKIKELYSTPASLPFEQFIADGVLHTHGPARINPRYDELSRFAGQQPSIYIVKWPEGHLARLWWKWNRLKKDDYLYHISDTYMPRRYSLPLDPRKARVLLERQLPRAIRAGEVTLDIIPTVFTFIDARPTHDLFLDIG